MTPRSIYESQTGSECICFMPDPLLQLFGCTNSEDMLYIKNCQNAGILIHHFSFIEII